MLTKTARIGRKFANSNTHFQQWSSSGLAELLNRIEAHSGAGKQKAQVMDLGPARQSIVELSAQRSFDLQIADVVSDLDVIDDDPGSIYSNGVFSDDDWERCLPATNAARVSAIFCWDILNYLGIEDIASLARCLARRCTAGAFLHSIIYTSETMPMNPLQFDLLLPSSLCRNSDNNSDNMDRLVPAPRYGLALTEQALRPFAAEHLYQLDAELQEEIYRYPGLDC